MFGLGVFKLVSWTVFLLALTKALAMLHSSITTNVLIFLGGIIVLYGMSNPEQSLLHFSTMNFAGNDPLTLPVSTICSTILTARRMSSGRYGFIITAVPLSFVSFERSWPDA